MRHLQPQFNKPSDLIFDYEFTRLFRSLEHEVLQTIQQLSEADSPEAIEKRMSQFSEHENVVMQYKDLIKNQDFELHILRSTVENLTLDRQKQNEKIEKLVQELQITKDQYALLKAKKSEQNSNLGSTNSTLINDSNQTIDSINNEKQSSNRILFLENKLDESNKEIEVLKQKLNDFSKSEDYINKISILEKELLDLRVANSNLLKDFENSKSIVKEFEVLKVEHSFLKTEHDDLLILLSEQEEKIKDFKGKLGIEESDCDDQEISEENID